MILQRNICPDDKEMLLYYRVTGKMTVSNDERISEKVIGKGGKLSIADETKISSDTYMNAFDIGAWKKHTCISKVYLTITISGKGILTFIREKKNGNKEKIGMLNFETVKGDVEQYQLMVPTNIIDGILYFEVASESYVSLYNAVYETDAAPLQEIKLSAVICTYHRRKQMEEMLKVLEQTDGIRSRWLHIKVIDNASELENLYGNGIRVYHNSNTGGSGGFTRGMEETVNDLSEFPATHVLLMDDDISLLPETIHRLYSLLSYLRPEYQKEVVAGRMFRKDNPRIQYTAAEIWNRGNLRHIGYNHDMTVRRNLWSMNDNTGGEYGGWWLCCYPIEFVKKNRPLPFFLHCDDVEYGLRHGGTPIILNGIQVWHETYEHRQTPAVWYYDTRNPLIVNAIYSFHQEPAALLQEWQKKLNTKICQPTKYMMIRAMWDFLKGPGWFLKIRTDRTGRKLKSAHTYVLRIGNILFRKGTETRAKFQLEKVLKGYRKTFYPNITPGTAKETDDV